MKAALAIYKYFPFGGLQRDMERLAVELRRRGHEVTVFCAEWHGEHTGGVRIVEMPDRAWSNTGKIADFERKFSDACRREKFDVRAVFNRMAGGDFYFAGDNALAVLIPSRHCAAVRLLPRYRALLRAERRLFAPENNCKIWYIAGRQKTDYQRCYGTPDDRFIYLPFGIDAEFGLPPKRRREAVSAALGIKDDDIMLIQIGSSNASVKGIDRTITALAHLPENVRKRTVLAVAGVSLGNSIGRLPAKLKADDRVLFLGGRSDVRDLISAADLMVHPARNEPAGSIIAEAACCGTPVLVSGICGYAFIAEAISPRLVLPEPFRQTDLDQRLTGIIQSGLPELKKETAAYAARTDFFSRAAVAADSLEKWVKEHGVPDMAE